MSDFKISIISVIALSVFASCSSSHRTNGFYEIADYPDDKIIGKPIVTIKDIDKARIDTVNSMPFITGSLTPSARARFAEATERLTGHRIGFVFNDSVVMAPKINSRIDGGKFQIISPDTALIYRIYKHI